MRRGAEQSGNDIRIVFDDALNADSAIRKEIPIMYSLHAFKKR